MEAIAGSDTTFDINHERLMLRHKLDLLEKFELDHEYEPDDVVDECRMLQYKIECIEGAIIWKNLAEEVLSLYEHQYSTEPDGFTDWIKRRGHDIYCSHSESLIMRSPATLCCPHKYCINCVYGFNRLENLEQHLTHHQPIYDQTVRRGSADSSSSEPMAMDVDKDDGVGDRQFTYVPFDPPSSSKKRQGGSLPYRGKRIMDKANMKLVKDQGACLRCKILKKRCDDRNPCSHCPLKDSNDKGDHWKVLGCHRSSLKDLSKLLLPRNSPCPEYRNVDGNQSQRRNNLNSEALVSASGAAPISYSANQRSNSGAHPIVLPSDQQFTMNWTTTAKGLFAIAESHKEFPIGTAYSPNDLMRNSKRICVDSHWQNNHKNELDLVHGIISEAIDFYMFEKELQVQMTAAENLSIIENHIPHDQKLREFLGAFSDSCSRRTSLSVQSWIELFHSLCLFSIYKTILIDAFAINSNHQHPRTWKHSNAIEIGSVYRTLVSIFSWASGVKDPMISQDIDLEDTNIYQVLKGTRELAKQNQWQERGIKSSKDFLMNLGSGLFDDGPFNGFVLQTYRLDEKLQQTTQKPRRGVDRISFDVQFDNIIPQTGSQSPLTSRSPDAISPTQDLNIEVPTTKTTVVSQWLDGLSTTSNTGASDELHNRVFESPSISNRHVFPRQQSGYSLRGNLSTPNVESLGGTHTESWLEDNPEVEDDVPPFSSIFEESLKFLME